MTVYLQPTGPTAEIALLPGDPKRAMELANRVMVAPRMSNLSRGLWGYHGETPLGRELTVQSTGIGGPSTAIVAHELAELGVRTAVRIGTCIGLSLGPAIGSTVLVSGAIGGTRAIGAAADPEPRADEGLSSLLRRSLPAAAGPMAVAEVELYYDRDSARRRSEWTGAGAEIADLSTAGLLAAGTELGIAVASVLIVSEDDSGERLPDEELDTALLALGESVAEAVLGERSAQSSETASRD